MTANKEIWAVIPATGVGNRMQADRPKQYLPLQHKTILEHTLDNLLAHPQIRGVVLVLHPQDEIWQTLGYQTDKPLLLCTGGVERQHSVLNGLNHLQQQCSSEVLVLIHDAVRPFVNHAELDRLIEKADECPGGAVLATPVADTLKRADAQGAIECTQDRAQLWRALTPQAFALTDIQHALQQAMAAGHQVTDDASAMELAGYHPSLIESSPINFKITTPADLVLAKLLIREKEWIQY